MEVSFDGDINLDEDNNQSNDEFELQTDYDNQKLFDIYESYLNKSDISDTESEPELSLNDHFYQRVAKTPVTNRSIRRFASFADIESQTKKSVAKSRSPNVDNSLDESMSELTLPWNLNDMTEEEVIDLINRLEEQLYKKETTYPQMSANYMKTVFNKQIVFLNHMIEESDNRFRTQLQEIAVKSDKERTAFNLLIDKELKDLKTKSDRLSTLRSDLNLIEELSNK